MRLLALFLLTATLASAQCTVHRRHLKNPLTWLNSNMCEAEWDEWQAAHPSHPFYKDKKFWLGVGIIGAAVAADGYTTSTMLDRGNIESNPLLGPHPSNRAIALNSLAGFGGYFGLHWIAYHYSHDDPSTPWREIGRWEIPIIAGSIHGHAAFHNSTLGSFK